MKILYVQPATHKHVYDYEHISCCHNLIGEVATFTYANGSTGQVAEAYFNNSQMDSTYTGSYTLNPETLLLPNLRGYGTVPDLYIAMSQNSTLLTMVQNLANDNFSSDAQAA